MKASKPGALGHQGYPHSTRSAPDGGQNSALADRRAREISLALGSVLYRAHDRARALERQLELESTDPRVVELHRSARALRKSIAAVLAGLATDSGRPRQRIY